MTCQRTVSHRCAIKEKASAFALLQQAYCCNQLLSHLDPPDFFCWFFWFGLGSTKLSLFLFLAQALRTDEVAGWPCKDSCIRYSRWLTLFQHLKSWNTCQKKQPSFFSFEHRTRFTQSDWGLYEAYMLLWQLTHSNLMSCPRVVLCSFHCVFEIYLSLRDHSSGSIRDDMRRFCQGIFGE